MVSRQPLSVKNKVAIRALKKKKLWDFYSKS